MKTAIIIALLMPFTAFAQLPMKYDCQVIVTANDLPNRGVVHKYEAIAFGTSHGGQEYVFDFQNHKVGVLSNSKWLALSWMRDGKQIAKATYARSEDTLGHHVLIVGHPENDEEQVSVDCAAK